MDNVRKTGFIDGQETTLDEYKGALKWRLLAYIGSWCWITDPFCDGCCVGSSDYREKDDNEKQLNHVIQRIGSYLNATGDNKPWVSNDQFDKLHDELGTAYAKEVYPNLCRIAEIAPDWDKVVAEGLWEPEVVDHYNAAQKMIKDIDNASTEDEKSEMSTDSVRHSTNLRRTNGV